MTDEELIAAYKRGEQSSLKMLVERSIKPIYNFVYSYVRSQEDAEDVTQETFIRAWKHIDRFIPGKRWRPWLFAIAKNTALDHLRRKKDTPFSHIENDNHDMNIDEIIEDTEPLAHEIFDSANDFALLSSVMSSLKPEYHSVLILHYHEELTFEEISEVLNVPMNTVKSWHRRALKTIRDIIGKNAPKLSRIT